NGQRVRDWVAAVNSKASGQLDVKRIQVVNADRMILIEQLIAYNNDKIANNNVANPDGVLNTVRPSLRNGTTSPDLRADALLDGWEKYADLYAKASNIGWYVYDESNAHQKEQRLIEKCVIGEFIIIDEKYLIRYSSQTGILEILMGRVVDLFAAQYKRTTFLNGFTVPKNDMARKLAKL
ncbi:MAG: hypothetical protein Q8O19_05555, partial [Rectinemataceae bacterium]|nr:hypothetical protein [Rectinemataceae bacterium]